jgi:hypothetical protein
VVNQQASLIRSYVQSGIQPESFIFACVEIVNQGVVFLFINFGWYDVAIIIIEQLFPLERSK